VNTLITPGGSYRRKAQFEQHVTVSSAKLSFARYKKILLALISPNDGENGGEDNYKINL